MYDTTVVYITREFDHSPERVFKALTNPEFLVQWFGPPKMITKKVDVDLRVGGKYSFFLEQPDGTPFTIEGIYQEIMVPEYLRFTLNYLHIRFKDMGESVVSIRLSPIQNGATQMNFKQEFTLVPDDMKRSSKAWEKMFDKVNLILGIT